MESEISSVWGRPNYVLSMEANEPPLSISVHKLYAYLAFNHSSGSLLPFVIGQHFESHSKGRIRGFWVFMYRCVHSLLQPRGTDVVVDEHDSIRYAMVNSSFVFCTFFPREKTEWLPIFDPIRLSMIACAPPIIIRCLVTC